MINFIFKSLDDDMEDSTSVLTLKTQTNEVYNNSIIRCQAFHQAYGIKTELSNMSSSLHIVVVCKLYSNTVVEQHMEIW